MGHTNTTKRLCSLVALLCVGSLMVGCFGFVGAPPPKGPHSPEGNKGTPGPPASPGTPNTPGTPAQPGQPPANPPTGQQPHTSGTPQKPPTDPGTPGNPPANPPSDPMPTSCQVKPLEIRRLSREEYKYTLKDLLGYNLDLRKSNLPPDADNIGFAVAMGVERVHAQAYMDLSEAIAGKFDLNKIGLPCAANKRDDACVGTWINNFGMRIYRRPLTKEERDRLHTLYRNIKGRFGTDMGIRVLLQFFLQSPHFLYRYEVGQATPTAAGLTRLKSFEVATRLSYFLWKSLPDTKLLQAAREGKLETKAQIEAHARRMLDDPKAKRTIHSFFEQWLELEKLDTTTKSKNYPFSPTLAQDMKRETLAFVDHVFAQGDASFKDLLTAPYSVTNKRLAAHYQLKNVDLNALQDNVFQKIPRDPSKFAGLLTMGSTMTIHSYADQTSPIHRGLFVRKHLLCHEIKPPSDVDLQAPEVNPNLTTRERFAQHRTDPNCAGCHVLMDPIGFGLDNYDPVGRYRSHEDNKNKDFIDGKGALHLTDDADGKFTGPVALAKRLAESQQVQECYVRQWYRYTFARQPGDGGDCFIKAIWQDFQASNFNIRELLISIATHQFFSCHKGSVKVTP